MSRIAIDIACNYPDNGLFDFCAEQINIGELAEFECLGRRAPRFREVDGGIVLSGKFWPVEGSRDWVGNWCWNRYILSLDRATDFLIWLHQRRLFHCSLAEERLFNLWRIGSPLPRDFIERMLGKPSNGAVC